MRGSSELSIVNGIQNTSADSPTEALVNVTQPAGSRRRRLSPDEERDIARLYADISTSTSEIRERFGIGDSTLYRVVQRHGVSLRGRAASPAKPSRPQTRVRASEGTTSLARRAPSGTGGGAQQRFRIQFRGESVVEAADIRDALRQAELLGATEITSVAREAR
jgi:transposase-like protein